MTAKQFKKQTYFINFYSLYQRDFGIVILTLLG